MIRKGQILEYLGEDALDLPRVLQDALSANEQVKYLFTLLQTARSNADDPGGVSSLPPLVSADRDMEVPDAEMVIAESWREPDGKYHIPNGRRLLDEIFIGMERMITPFRLAGDEREATFENRLRELRTRGESVNGTAIDGGTIDWITSASHDDSDTPHLLVMHIHRALNDLQAEISTEVIDGAQVYGLQASDRPYVRAFVSGVNRTSPLKFDHPGLSTTATHSASGLTIQNDIGTTDAHVFVVSITDHTASFTYTDVHRLRVEFFQRMLATCDVEWERSLTCQSDRLAEGEPFYVINGRCRQPDSDALCTFLEYLGSRLVFLIDWNRARKRLRPFLRKTTAIALLDWAAAEEVGHRAFLQVGGQHMLEEAVASAAAGHTTSRRLDKMLGEDTTVELLKNLFRSASQNLREGRSERLIRDELRADLLTVFETAQESLLDLAYDQAALIGDLADRLRSGLYGAMQGPDLAELSTLARRAKSLEKRADELVGQARGILQRIRANTSYGRLFTQIDDVADGLEEATFLLTLLPRVRHTPGLYEPVVRLADLAVRGARAFVSCVESARHVHRGGSRTHTRDFLEAVDLIVTIEHDADAAQRAVIAELYESSKDFRQLHLFEAIADSLETSTDVLARCGYTLRDLVLSDLATGFTTA